MGIAFEVVVSGVEEVEEGPAEEVALQNAVRKARAVAAQRLERSVLGVDTVVSLEGVLYGKPQDRAQAARTLRALGGRGHQVISGLCLIEPGASTPDGALTAAATTRVRFRHLDDALLDWYLDTEEWRGRAGGYAVQGRGAALVEAIEGDYLNVVGLPVAALLQLAPRLLSG